MTSIPAIASIDTKGEQQASWIILFVGVLSSTALVAFASDDIGLKIAAMFILSGAASAAVKFDIAHPFVWFAGAFTLYSISGPLLFHMGVHPYTTWGGYRVEELSFAAAMDYQFFALLIALLVIGPRRVTFAGAMGNQASNALFRGSLPVLIAACVIGLANILQIMSQDFASKGDVVLTGDWTTRLSFAFNIAATALGVYLAKLFSEGRPLAAYTTLIVVVTVGIVMVLLIGQRHFLFRAGLVSLLVFHIFHQRISIRSLLVLAGFALTLSSMLGGYKMSLVVQDLAPVSNASLWEQTQLAISLKNPEFLNNSTFMQYVKVALAAGLGSEAMTPGNNMAMLLARVPQDLPYFYGTTLPGDLLRSILPGFIIQPYVETTSVVYNRLVFPDTAATGGGVGFTIAGYGYLHFGEIGLIAIMLLIGVSLRRIYHWASQSSTGLMFYIGFFPVAVYVARNDITGPLSQGLKHVLIPLVAMSVIAHFMGDRAPRYPHSKAGNTR